jgi:hypothetical protein
MGVLPEVVRLKRPYGVARVSSGRQERSRRGVGIVAGAVVPAAQKSAKASSVRLIQRGAKTTTSVLSFMSFSFVRAQGARVQFP